ncbi:sugar ABC transporter permease [Pseudocolwellia sp. AS88]|jgi:sorbitol/mannitol transport system permease protein|uniref:carbohydrate ABC transporter permease n=1 Tax=Pseudocolwellia TaxID=2848177 RepID=UPI0026EDF612|nr:sugar ABC transporter permease [Pseudocolwellia sp. AS88]MDO7083975.1 sugar ABC transporter permease [Pseudocolwellia sp. AS88]
MATNNSRALARAMLSPAVILLLIWMVVPLVMTIYFSFLDYNLFMPGEHDFIGLLNYEFFLTDPAFVDSFFNTIILVVGVLFITLVGGTGLAILLDQAIYGRNFVRIMVLAPFFVMPTVSALVWKNMFMNPVNGLFAYFATSLGFEPIDFLSQMPLTSIIIIVSWQWLPFASLILLTAIQSLDREQLEAAELDGAGKFSRFRFMVLPHLSRAMTAVVLIETIFLLSIFAEILVTTAGGPGNASTNISYLIYSQSLLEFDVGMGSAGGLVAVIIANIVAIFLMRMIGKNIEG